MPLGQNLFKLVSNNGTEVGEVHGAGADNVRDAVNDTVVSMSPEFGSSRSETMQLRASRVSLSIVSHMQVADISQDNSNAYKGTVIVPCWFLKGLRSLGDSAGGWPYYYGCPQCKKAIQSDGTTNQVVGATVVLRDPALLWKTHCGRNLSRPCALNSELGLKWRIRKFCRYLRRRLLLVSWLPAWA